MKNLIKEAFERPDSEDAIHQIESLMRNIEEDMVYGEAHLRRLLGKITAPPIAKPSKRLKKQIAKLEGFVNPSILESAVNLTGALMTRIPSAQAGISMSSLGRIQVSWNQGLLWEFSLSLLPWPGIRMRAHPCWYGVSPDPSSKSFWYAQSAIEHAIMIMQLTKDGEVSNGKI